MDNPKLLDALRTCAEIDAEKDKIRSMLAKQGWSVSEIEEFVATIAPSLDEDRATILAAMTAKGEA